MESADGPDAVEFVVEAAEVDGGTEGGFDVSDDVCIDGIQSVGADDYDFAGEVGDFWNGGLGDVVVGIGNNDDAVVIGDTDKAAERSVKIGAAAVNIGIEIFFGGDGFVIAAEGDNLVGAIDFVDVGTVAGNISQISRN